MKICTLTGMKVWATNWALGSKNQEVRDLKNKAKGMVQQLEALVAEKAEKLKCVATELERAQKALRLLNNGMNRLDHMITSRKSFGDHNGVGFKGEFSSTKTVFIKFGLLVNFVDAENYKPVIRSIASEDKSAI